MAITRCTNLSNYEDGSQNDPCLYLEGNFREENFPNLAATLETVKPIAPTEEKNDKKDNEPVFELLPSFSQTKDIAINPDLKKFKFGALGSLPRAPHPIPEDNIRGCNWYILDEEELKIPLSNDIRKKGWAILSEAQLGKYELIAFAGKFEVETSATCYVRESAIAIFDNGSLLGVIYLEGRDDVLIGHLEQMEDGFVRLFSGDPLRVSVADLNLGTDGLTIGPISTKPLSYCYGKTKIPHVLGMPIGLARNKLFKSGFNLIEREHELGDFWINLFPGVKEFMDVVMA